MTIELNHNFTRAGGHVIPLSLNAWAATLSSADQAAFAVAAAKQKAIMDAAKASGNLISEVGFKQVWRDGPVVNDPDWKAFFNRFLAETNTEHAIA